jgi:serine/threonine protein kinase
MLPDLQMIDDSSGLRKFVPNVAVVPDKVPVLRGYTLDKRIGSGGSGEVWKATAPGKPPKAVKIIFGCLDERRATQEVKALNRVRALSHEFLLSLESIEVTDGRVVIVTDLADSSLRDRLEECRSAGASGIPRAELMNYLFETAEALDYLENDFGLQHLDIKPENLLLLAGHIKIADFGLLKDITEGNSSLINGLTPKYAAPELFDGKPNRHSDQYSLAIVFQELATGTSPFSGRTAAQLASQHLHSMPDLTSLSPLERFAVGKALAKDPAMRFGSCREFVERLVPRSRTKLLTGATPRIDSDDRPQSGLRPSDEVRRHDGQTVEVRAPESVRLPAINLESARPNYRPALFLGIGHTGGRILNRLKHLLFERFGLEKSLPAFQLLYIDTDVDAVSEVIAVPDGGKLSEAETLLLPIHSTWNYRNSAVSQIGSLSRRWLYNIPRSQKTEGMRALGRLAFLDHAERVKTRIRKAILSACDREALAATTAATGLPFSSCDPRVFMVASPGGGTGSGMLIDAAYAMRQLLIETGFSDDEVIGILPFVTRQSQTGAYLAPANALACLQELRHYSIAGNYPGEPACGLAGFCEKSPTFAQTYFLELGERLADDAFAEEANKVASYILLNAITPASPFFDAARKNDAEPDSDFKIRTFALESLGADAHDVSAQLIDRLCHTVVLNWRGYGVADPASRGRRATDRTSLADHHAKEAFIHRIASSYATEIGLEFRLLYKAVIRLVDVDGRTNANSLVNNLVAESLGPAADAQNGGDISLAPVIQKIHQFVGVHLAPETEGRPDNESLREMLLEVAHRHGRQFGESLEEWILSLVDRTEFRVAGSEQVADWLHARLGALVLEGMAQTKNARQSREELLAALNSASRTACSAPGSNGTSAANTLRQYAHLLLQELTSEAVLKCLDVIDAFVLRSSDRLRDFWKDLNRLAEEFGSAQLRRRTDAPENRLEQIASGPDGFAAATFGEMTDKVADEIERSFFREQCSLRGILAQNCHLRPHLVVTLREAANKAVRKASRQMIVSRLNEAIQQGIEPQIDRVFGRCLASLKSVADRYGGATRLLLSLPDKAFSTRIAARAQTLLDDDPTLVCDPE